jgi:hypothetical protein
MRSQLVINYVLASQGKQPSGSPRDAARDEPDVPLPRYRPSSARGG